MKQLLAHSAFTKVLVLLALAALLALPLSEIGGLIRERGQFRDAARQALATAHAGPQQLTGPVLLVPYVERWVEEERDASGAVKARHPRSAERLHVVFPRKLDVNGQLQPQERYRGIYKVMFYELAGTLGGSFPAFDADALPREHKGSTLEALAPRLVLALSDLRGLQGTPRLTLGGEATVFVPRLPTLPAGSWLAGGLHALLPPAALQAWRGGQPLAFDLRLALVGQEKLSIVPLADETTARLASSWPHPGFGGHYLARERTVGEAGFEARWAVSSLASSGQPQAVLTQAARKPGEASQRVETFDVSLVEPLDAYALSARALKYGMLFVGLTLMAAFMFELFARLRLHPVQYGLVGLAIALFFLLLLALSEKIAFGLAFGLAYAGAAGASVALLTVYFSAILGGWRRGAALGGFIAVLYAALYGLLASEDNALLLGALLLFALLAVLMLATRRVDWYALAGREPAAQTVA